MKENLKNTVAQVIGNCVACIVGNAKAGKLEKCLTPINKADKPIGPYHIDHFGPMEVTKKRYNHLLVIVDAFTKFVWLYLTMSKRSRIQQVGIAM